MRSPMFTVVTLLTIAIGVGANSAVFSVVSGVLLKPLPYPEPDELIGVWQTSARLNIKDLEASPSDYFTFREENRTFRDFGVWNGGSVAVTGGSAAPEQVQCVVVTEGTLNALGVGPALGRWFTAEDDKPRHSGDGDSHVRLLAAQVRRQSGGGGQPADRGRKAHGDCGRDAAVVPVSG